MSAILGVAVAAGELREVPKLGINMEELCFAYGCKSLVTELRELGVLLPAKRHGRVLLFDVTHVRAVWAQYLRGEFDEMLKRRGGPLV